MPRRQQRSGVEVPWGKHQGEDTALPCLGQYAQGCHLPSRRTRHLVACCHSTYSGARLPNDDAPWVGQPCCAPRPPPPPLAPVPTIPASAPLAHGFLAFYACPHSRTFDQKLWGLPGEPKWPGGIKGHGPEVSGCTGSTGGVACGERLVWGSAWAALELGAAVKATMNG